MSVHALLVGINNYHPQSGVSSLNGCVNDVNAMEAYLKKYHKNDELKIKKLLNEQATRDEVLNAFKTHLIGPHVKDNDIVLFYYSGHGSYAPSAPEFVALKIDTKEQDETLVLYDTRLDDNYDLADKELALLLAAVNQQAFITVMLDCCHSGSATRSIADEIRSGLPRFTPASANVTSRALSRYVSAGSLDYSKMSKIEVPSSRHILLAACDREELAYEAAEPCGLFTSSVLKVLASGAGSSYAALHQYVYTVIKRKAGRQTPQLKVYGGFNPNLVFLNSSQVGARPNCHISYKKQDSEWVINYGALNGMPADEAVLAGMSVAVYKNDNSGQLETTASVLKTRLNETVLQPHAALDPKQIYAAAVLNHPPALCIYMEDNAASKHFLDVFDKAGYGKIELLFHHDPESYHDVIVETDKTEIRILDARNHQLLHGINEASDPAIIYIIDALRQIATWKSIEKMRPGKTNIRAEEIEFTLQIRDEAGVWTDCAGEHVTLDVSADRPEIPFRIKLANNSSVEYYVAIYRLSPKFAIEKYTSDVDASLLTKDKVPAIICNTPDYDPYTFFLEDDVNEDTDIYKLVISKEKFEDYFVEQSTELERSVRPALTGKMKGVKRGFKGDWAVKTITVRLVKQLQKLDAQNSFSNNVLTIREHPAFAASVALTSADSSAKAYNPAGILGEIFSGGEFSFLNLSPGQKGLDALTVVELTGVAGEDSLQEHPLTMNLHQPLGENEQVLAVSFSDGMVVPLGIVEKSVDGNDHTFHLHQAPVNTDARRAAGKNPLRALWFCFLKVVLRREGEVFKLRALNYVDGKMDYDKNPPAAAISDKNNILLVIHGIIGNTKSIASNLSFLLTDDQYPYDCMIAFDYENLNTKIEDIAARLKEKLVEAGVSENKKIDILAHSMGGLVSRYFVEKLEGYKMVNRVILVGVPNNGSAFGKLVTLRNWATGVLTLVCNFGKQFLGQFGPFLEALNAVLGATKPVTNTLEQMKTGSDFLQELNKFTGHPVSAKYFVIAGNTSNYALQDEALLTKTVEKLKLAIGKLAYWNETNDIAVSVDSIKKAPKTIVVKETEIGCHHMNYFAYQASLNVLKEIMQKTTA
jgi:triacylglycerol esterase/lipase EstA (alpha/beta hydrolase family)